MQSLNHADTYAAPLRILRLSLDRVQFEMWLLKHTWKTKIVFVRSILKSAIFRIMIHETFGLEPREAEAHKQIFCRVFRDSEESVMHGREVENPRIYISRGGHGFPGALFEWQTLLTCWRSNRVDTRRSFSPSLLNRNFLPRARTLKCSLSVSCFRTIMMSELVVLEEAGNISVFGGLF
jgi:hypothetical protein